MSDPGQGFRILTGLGGISDFGDLTGPFGATCDGEKTDTRSRFVYGALSLVAQVDWAIPAIRGYAHPIGFDGVLPGYFRMARMENGTQLARSICLVRGKF